MQAFAALVLLQLSAAPDAPLALPELHIAALSPGHTLEAARGAVVAQVDPAESLANARRLVSELRYEEAVVEYQRYLSDPQRPVSERARATFELAFIHLALGDERTAQVRAFEALELDPTLRLPSGAPERQARFLETSRKAFESRTRLEILSSGDASAPQKIRVRLTDPSKTATSVLLRHALAATGPFYAQRMLCEEELCIAEIPAPAGTDTFTAWYYVEANDRSGNTVATGASAAQPLRVSIVQREPWYRSPWVYAGGAAAIVTAAAIFYAASGSGR